MKKLFSILVGLLLILLTGCSSAPQLNSNQRTQMRTRTYEANYETTYRSLMITLENQGYTIDNTDMNSGLIKAITSKDTHSLFGTILTGQTGVAKFSISASVSKISDENTRVRINAREDKTVRQGLYTRDSANEIDDELVYNQLFGDLRLEIEKFKAIN
ncbi:MAG: hypothetical protein ACRC5T_08090 [Cetobacterium sp.]